MCRSLVAAGTGTQTQHTDTTFTMSTRVHSQRHTRLHTTHRERDRETETEPLLHKPKGTHLHEAVAGVDSEHKHLRGTGQTNVRRTAASDTHMHTGTDT